MSQDKMKLFVEDYVANDDYHICVDEKGKKHRVDILVDGGLENKDRKALVGKTIACDYLHPFIEIASGVEEVPNEPRQGERI
jgi:hypothetical protein